MSMEIRPDRMVSLGYGKYWRSDAIVGLTPIEEDRGPGRRTEVYTATVEDPVVASRSEQAILRDMSIGTDQQFQIQEAMEMLADMLDALEEIPDVLDRMLVAEAQFDVAKWRRRIQALLRADGPEVPDDQNDLFSG
ncbi:hypothetical protein ACFL3B_02790 [Gemmatimonadota bacterium]